LKNWQPAISRPNTSLIYNWIEEESKWILSTIQTREGDNINEN
jgi:hypothetical protein